MSGQHEQVRRVIEQAPVMPPAPEPFEEEPPSPRRVRTDVIVLLGLASSTVGESVERYGLGEALCIYRDSFRRLRTLRPAQHDRMTLRSLFIGYEKTLTQLWPRANRRAGFDHHHAAEALIADLGRVGCYWPKKGEQLAAEADNRGYLLIEATRFASQTMQRFGDPYLTLCRLRTWATGSLALSETDITIIVNRLAGRLLRRQRRYLRG